mmetsp:Transcript_55791/g.103226  ORF Transcript_55791/g.103226 Transcript_55791/m.103226 type:complete len:301 (+) Transcript_55791:91-993(+)
MALWHLLWIWPCMAVAVVDIPTKEIAPGVHMPYISIGTWTSFTKTEDKNVSRIINNWLDLGAVGIDTAYIYFTQKEIADTLQKRGADRKKLFITSKIPECFGEAAARSFVDADLKALQTDYIDLMLIHAPGLPGPLGGCDSTWKVLEEYVAAGKLRAIGVSNWRVKDFKSLKYTIKPAVNQIEYNVYSHDDEAAQYCRENGILLEAWSPLGDPARTHKSIFSDDKVLAVAKKHNISAGQVALRWLYQKGILITFLSTNKEHQANDADIFNIELDSDDVKALDALKEPSVMDKVRQQWFFV